MTAIAIMAEKLDQELQDRGIFGVGHADCLRIVRNMIDHASEVAEESCERQQPKAEKTV